MNSEFDFKGMNSRSRLSTFQFVKSRNTNSIQAVSEGRYRVKLSNR